MNSLHCLFRKLDRQKQQRSKGAGGRGGEDGQGRTGTRGCAARGAPASRRGAPETRPGALHHHARLVPLAAQLQVQLQSRRQGPPPQPDHLSKPRHQKRNEFFIREIYRKIHI
jgi:hypothetical protein